QSDSPGGYSAFTRLSLVRLTCGTDGSWRVRRIIAWSYCLDIVWRPLVDGVKVGVCCDTLRVRVILRDSLRCVVRPNGRLEWTWIRILACPGRSSLFTHRCTMEFSPHRHHNPKGWVGGKK